MGVGERLRRFGVRCAGLYLFLYMLPWIPGARRAAWPLRALTLRLIHALVDPGYRPPLRTGSGDTLLDWVQVPVLLSVAVVGAALWTGIDRCRSRDRTFRRILWVAARDYLGLVMITYGVVKLVGLQFRDLGLTELVTSYGDSSPMALLWRFMGHSRAYTIATGVVEIAGGALLLSRKTVTLGALLTTAALANVVALNMTYDVPVKLFSTHLLVIALALLASDWRRLLAVLVTEGSAPPRLAASPFAGRRARLAALAAQGLVVGFIAWRCVDVARFRLPPRRRPALYGLYEVEAAERGPESWTRMVVEHPGQVTVWSGATQTRYRARFDGESLVLHGASGSSYRFRVERPAPDRLELHGHGTVVRLRARDPDDFLLERRGFHWVSEYPFYR